MKTFCFEQRTPEWFGVRKGVPTASCASRIITPTGKPSTQQTQYMNELAAEYVSGVLVEPYTNGDMKRGIELEPEARLFYEFIEGVSVEQVGFCLSEEGYGCSPDGLINSDGGLQIKCPKPSTHVQYLLDGKLPYDYKPQVQMELLVTGRSWWDFLSYCPNMKHFIVRVEPDEDFQKALRSELIKFCQELNEVIKKIQ